MTFSAIEEYYEDHGDGTATHFLLRMEDGTAFEVMDDGLGLRVRDTILFIPWHAIYHTILSNADSLEA
ncbi:MAG: hypothetical protein RML46_12755 [Anaerolineae bacterium]|nr:hypothetical protein [Anaerolineae bacterium]